MDPLSVATYMMQAQSSQTQLDLATAMVRSQNNESSQIIAMVDSGAQSGGAGNGTGQYLNTYA